TCFSPRHNLHSFPTRRSSDLTTNGLQHGHTTRRFRREKFLVSKALHIEVHGFGRCGNTREQWHRRAFCRLDQSWGGAGADQKSRSEEHTSELQSRENLVCRLL